MIAGGPPVRSQRAHEESFLRNLPLPGHVMVLTDEGWQRGWLIARENGPTGWNGLVQYDDGDAEITGYLPADHIASPDVWIEDEPAPEPDTAEPAPGRSRDAQTSSTAQ
jgi:hypothetical protein